MSDASGGGPEGGAGAVEPAAGPSPGAGRRFSIRRAGPGDAETLIGLFNRAFHKQKDARTARWKYLDSPHGASRTYLAEDGGVSGGAYSYVYRRMTWNGAPFVGTQASDAMVDEAFRRRGIFTTLDDECARECGAEGAPVCFATAGRQSMHGFLKNGWKEIGTYQTYLAVLDPAGLLRPRLPRPLAALGGAALGLLLGLTGRRPPLAPPAGFEARPVERFDARYDDLWERVRGRLPLAGVRDAAFLNWRYVDTPTAKHHVLEVRRDGRLAGYAVYEWSFGRGYVVDLLGEDEAAEDAALRAALVALRDAGNPMAFLSTLPCAVTAALLRRNRLFPHPRRKAFRNATPFIVRVLRDDGNPGPSALLDPGAWYVLDGDRDVEHMSPEA